MINIRIDARSSSRRRRHRHTHTRLRMLDRTSLVIRIQVMRNEPRLLYLIKHVVVLRTWMRHANVVQRA